MNCPYCHSGHIISRKYVKGERNYQCKKCGRYFPESKAEHRPGSSRGEYSVITKERPKNEEDILRICEVDTTVWEIDHWLINKWEMGRKHSVKDLKYVKGKATGTIKDDGELSIEPMWQVKVWLKRKSPEATPEQTLESLKMQLKEFAPTYPKLQYPKTPGTFLYEVDMPDLHFGKLTWNEETGEDFDIKLAQEVVEKVVATLVGYIQNYDVSRILIPFGNDFFNVDNKREETTHGTPQQEDTRWQKTYVKGRKLATWVIDQFSAVAPVDVLVIAGNHDEERTFYLGDALECWYHNCPNVTIDNRPPKRKYYSFGRNLIGFTHGYWEKLSRLPSLMPLEAPKQWAESTYREFHLGDKHHKQDLLFAAEEMDGVVIRTLRALTTTDGWHFDKGYVGALRAAESFLWHPDNGLIAQFTAHPNIV